MHFLKYRLIKKGGSINLPVALTINILLYIYNEKRISASFTACSFQSIELQTILNLIFKNVSTYVSNSFKIIFTEIVHKNLIKIRRTCFVYARFGAVCSCRGGTIQIKHTCERRSTILLHLTGILVIYQRYFFKPV